MGISELLKNLQFSEPPQEFKDAVADLMTGKTTLQEVLELGGKLAMERSGGQESANGLGEVLAASLSGKPCPSCGEVYPSPLAFAIPLGGKNETPQVPVYEESDGVAAEFEYTPKKMRAIQLLPHNAVAVAEFLIDNDATFFYVKNPEGEHRFLLPNLNTMELNTDTEELVYSKWVVVSGSRAEGNLAYSAVDDASFRNSFQPVVKGFTPDVMLEDEADDLLSKAEQDAMAAYGDNDE